MSYELPTKTVDGYGKPCKISGEEFRRLRDGGLLHLIDAGDKLVIRDGVVATKDGSNLKEYLASCGLYEGAPINVCHHTALRATIDLAEIQLARCT